MRSEHFVFWGVNWASPVLLLCLASVALQFIQRFFADRLMQWGFAMNSAAIEVDEDLPNFWSVVKWTEAIETVKTSNDSRERLQFEQAARNTIQRLTAIERLPEVAIQGSPWYTLLASKAYQKQFAYVGAQIAEREKLIEDGYPDAIGIEGEEHVKSPKEGEYVEYAHHKWEQSDMVMVLLNLAAIPDEVAKSVDYTQVGWSKVFS